MERTAQGKVLILTNFQKIATPTPIGVVMFKSKICPTEKSVKSCVIQNAAASQTVATARIAPEICQGQTQHLAHTVPDFIQIGSLSAEL